MTEHGLSMFFICCGFVLSLAVVATVKYFAEYRYDISSVKEKADSTVDWNEYIFWKRKLRILYLSLLPVLNPDRVMCILDMCFHRKHRKKQTESDGLTAVILPSVIGICLCSVCLVGGTFAWFSASESLPAIAIESARYDVEVTVEPQVSVENGKYKLIKGATYSVTLKAEGDASTGYCILNFEDAEVHTVQFSAIGEVEKITFEIMCKRDISMEITPQWGISSVKEESAKIGNGGKYPFQDIGSQSLVSNTNAIGQENGTQTVVPYTEYTVQSGDNLHTIAAAHNTTVQTVQEYNKLVDPSLIYVGQELKIPITNEKS